MGARAKTSEAGAIMMKTVLFDLDGTLLPMDTDHFLEQYLRALTPRVAHLVPPKQFVEHLLASTYAMVVNTDDSRTNQEVFIDDFFRRVGCRPEEMMPIFDDFYRKDFCELRACARESHVPRLAVEAAVESGLEIALATNPVFPMEAIQERMRWAGVADFPWRLITSYENMHYCKPQLGIRRY